MLTGICPIVQNDLERELIAAAERGDLRRVQESLLAGVNVNIRTEDGLTALHYAARGGYLPIVRALLAAPGIDVNHPENDGYTALHKAALHGHLEIVQALLTVPGINLHIQTIYGNTARRTAVSRNFQAIVAAIDAHAGL